jgi:uncharacterized protein (TIGR00297 family)
LLPILLAYFAAGLVALLGYRVKALSIDGAIAACIVGGTILGFGGWVPAILLVFFFASSSALSFVGANDPRKRRAVETFEKGGRRDAAQVIANGGVAALLAFLSYFADSSALPLLGAALVGALAEATADTWATEIGVLSKQQPRLITTGRPAPAGTSGAITALGTAAGDSGALVTGIVAALASSVPIFGSPFGGAYAGSLVLIAAALVGGTIGMLFDSLLGATVQASYICPRCQKPTESRVHHCGTPTELVHGLPWLNNDLVNLLSTAMGAVVAGLVHSLF